MLPADLDKGVEAGVAAGLGYESASSFVVMFRKALGSSPARYVASRGASSPGAVSRDLG